MAVVIASDVMRDTVRVVGVGVRVVRSAYRRHRTAVVTSVLAVIALALLSRLPYSMVHRLVHCPCSLRGKAEVLNTERTDRARDYFLNHANVLPKHDESRESLHQVISREDLAQKVRTDTSLADQYHNRNSPPEVNQGNLKNHHGSPKRKNPSQQTVKEFAAPHEKSLSLEKKPPSESINGIDNSNRSHEIPDHDKHHQQRKKPHSHGERAGVSDLNARGWPKRVKVVIAIITVKRRFHSSLGYVIQSAAALHSLLHQQREDGHNNNNNNNENNNYNNNNKYNNNNNSRPNTSNDNNKSDNDSIFADSFLFVCNVDEHPEQHADAVFLEDFLPVIKRHGRISVPERSPPTLTTKDETKRKTMGENDDFHPHHNNNENNDEKIKMMKKKTLAENGYNMHNKNSEKKKTMKMKKTSSSSPSSTHHSESKKDVNPDNNPNVVYDKEREDYAFCLRAALARGPRYVLVVEDDTLTLPSMPDVVQHALGWLEAPGRDEAQDQDGGGHSRQFPLPSGIEHPECDDDVSHSPPPPNPSPPIPAHPPHPHTPTYLPHPPPPPSHLSNTTHPLLPPPPPPPNPAHPHPNLPPFLYRNVQSLDRNAPSLDRNAPYIDRNTPSLDRNAPSLDRNTPSLDRNASSLDRNAPSLDRNAPFLDRNAPSLDRNAQFVDRNTLSLERNALPLPLDRSISFLDRNTPSSVRNASLSNVNSTFLERNTLSLDGILPSKKGKFPFIKGNNSTSDWWNTLSFHRHSQSSDTHSTSLDRNAQSLDRKTPSLDRNTSFSNRLDQQQASLASFQEQKHPLPRKDNKITSPPPPPLPPPSPPPRPPPPLASPPPVQLQQQFYRPTKRQNHNINTTPSYPPPQPQPKPTPKTVTPTQGHLPLDRVHAIGRGGVGRRRKLLSRASSLPPPLPNPHLHPPPPPPPHPPCSVRRSRFSYLKLYFPPDWQGFALEPSRLMDLLSMASVSGTALGTCLWLCCRCPAAVLGNRRTAKIRALGFGRVLALSFLVSLAACVVLGRQNVNEARRVSKHLYRLQKSSDCCTPAVLFPASLVPEVLRWLDGECEPREHLDLCLARFSRSSGLPGYSLEPNLVAHVGIVTTLRKGNKNWVESLFYGHSVGV